MGEGSGAGNLGMLLGLCHADCTCWLRVGTRFLFTAGTTTIYW